MCRMTVCRRWVHRYMVHGTSSIIDSSTFNGVTNTNKISKGRLNTSDGGSERKNLLDERLLDLILASKNI